MKYCLRQDDKKEIALAMKYITMLLLFLCLMNCRSSALSSSSQNINKNNSIVKYELWWSGIYKNNPNFILITEGEDPEICKNIEKAMSNTIASGGGESTQVKLSSTGILKVFYKDRKKEIHITEIGFFPDNGKWLDKLFYSESLANIIDKLIKNSTYKNKIPSEKEFFNKMKVEFYKHRKWLSKENT